jgi:hypothetical protein
MVPHVARHLISRNPKGERVFTGRYDADGEPILRAVQEKVRPGTVFFPTDDAERVWLIEMRAARPLDDAERPLYQQGRTTGFPVDVEDALEKGFTRTTEVDFGL